MTSFFVTEQSVTPVRGALESNKNSLLEKGEESLGCHTADTQSYRATHRLFYDIVMQLFPVKEHTK